MKHEMAEQDENFFETMKKNAMGLVVASFFVAGSQTAAHGRSVDTRGLGGARAWWGGTQHLRPSQNGWVWVSNGVIQGLRDVVQEAGFVSW
jgi:hypothetical protein